MAHRYQIEINLAVSEHATEETIREFVKALGPVGEKTCLNAGDNEEGPFLNGQLIDVQITRRPE